MRQHSQHIIWWNPEGTVFDQSIDGETLRALPIDGLGEAALIEGWKEGLIGMKIGGVRELTIPSDLAYGEQGGGNEDIPGDTPLKFVIYAIEKPEEIPQPELPEGALNDF